LSLIITKTGLYSLWAYITGDNTRCMTIHSLKTENHKSLSSIAVWWS